MRFSDPIDGWSAYYALLTDALSRSPRSGPRSTPRSAKPRAATPRAPKAPRVSLLERIDHWFSDQRTRARDRYLAESSGLAELESRMREINRYY